MPNNVLAVHGGRASGLAVIGATGRAVFEHRQQIASGLRTAGRTLSRLYEQRMQRSERFERRRNLRDMGGQDTNQQEGSMADATHGDGADAVDSAFGRDAEGTGTQKQIAGALWNICPRIYDDEVIVRLPLVVTMSPENPSGTAALYTYAPGLAAAGPPLVPTVDRMAAAAFQLNNVFTPYTSDTAHKPRGYSWYASLYKYYQVLEARITYTIQANTDLVSTAAPATTDTPHSFVLCTTDLLHTDFSAAAGSWDNIHELAMSNGAAKSARFSHPTQITWHNGQADIPTRIKLQTVWTPGQFDDLQTNITLQPMTAIGSPPNWINYCDLYCINYNTTQPTNNVYYTISIHTEFLVHFKKVSMTQYIVKN